MKPTKDEQIQSNTKWNAFVKWMKIASEWKYWRFEYECLWRVFFLICCEFAFGVVLKLACDYISFHLSLLMTQTVAITWFCCAKNIVCLLKWAFYKRCPFPIQRHFVNTEHTNTLVNATQKYTKSPGNRTESTEWIRSFIPLTKENCNCE